MKLIKFAFILAGIVCAGGFIYFAFSDPRIERAEVVKEIPHERFFGDQ